MAYRVTSDDGHPVTGSFRFFAMTGLDGSTATAGPSAPAPQAEDPAVESAKDSQFVPVVLTAAGTVIALGLFVFVLLKSRRRTPTVLRWTSWSSRASGCRSSRPTRPTRPGSSSASATWRRPARTSTGGPPRRRDGAPPVSHPRRRLWLGPGRRSVGPRRTRRRRGRRRPVLIEAAIEDHPGTQWLVGDLAELDLAAQGVAADFEVVVAGNVMPFLAPSTRRECSSACAARSPSAAGSSSASARTRLRLRRLPRRRPGLGLEPDLLLAGWDLRPFRDDSDFLVAILRPA